MRKIYLILIYIFISFFAFCQTNVTVDKIRGIAIIDCTLRNGETDNSNLYSAEYIMKTMGIPYIITTDVNVATTYAVILTSSDLVGSTTFSPAEISNLISYVRNGGVWIAPFVTAPEFYQVFGINDYLGTVKHHYLMWADYRSDPALHWINDSLEETICFGNEKIYPDTVIYTTSYQLTTATALAHFEDNKTGVCKNHYGNGWAYALGYDFNETILLPQMNYDYEAQRIYCCGFEPSADVILFFVKGLFAKHVKDAAWLHTSPYDQNSVLIYSHDVDGLDLYDTMSCFTDLEKQYNIPANYFLTTHYISDDQDIDYYDPSISKITTLINSGFAEVGSHSVGHFTNFNVFPVGKPGNTRANYNPTEHMIGGIERTPKGTIFGECEVSRDLLDGLGANVKNFRAGFLLYPDSLDYVLDSLGYLINSTNSANDVLTNFPYFGHKALNFSSPVSNVLELPLSCDTDPDNQSPSNILDFANTYMKSVQKIHKNHAITVILTHPNHKYKTALEKYFFDHRLPKMLSMTMENFGSYWRKRDKFSFLSNLSHDTLSITIPNNTLPNYNQMSIVIRYGNQLSKIFVKQVNGTSVAYKQAVIDDSDLVIYFQDAPTGIEENIHTNDLFFKNFPNPFTDHTTLLFTLENPSNVLLEIYDLQGRKVSTLLNKNMEKGLYDIGYNSINLVPGTYICRLITNNEVLSIKMIKTQ